MVERLCNFIDNLNNWVGKILMWFFLPLMLLIVTDVFTRYVLNKPWYYLDINIQLMGCIAVVGAGYGLLHGAHIGVDCLVANWSERKRAVLDIILYPLFFLGVGALLWKVADASLYSISVTEHSATSASAMPLYPYKTTMVFGVFFLFLQGMSKFLRDIMMVFSRRQGGEA